MERRKVLERTVKLEGYALEVYTRHKCL